MIVLRHIGSRLVTAVPVLVAVTLGTYVLLFAVGDVATAVAGEYATTEQIEALRRSLGLDEPLLQQYGDWLSGVVQGDLGQSFRTGRDVAELISQRVGATVSLALVSLVFSLLVAVPLASLGARHAGTVIDRITRSTAVLGLSIPNFFLGLLFVLFFAVRLGWLPAVGYVRFGDGPWEWFQHLILPGATLGLSLAGEQARTLRASLGAELASDYVRTARAKNVPELVVVARHAGRNAMLPLVTVIGLQAGRILAGAVLVEAVFAIPGLGLLVTEAVITRDLPIVQAMVVLTAGIVLVANLVVDLSYLALSPSTRAAS